MSELLRLEADDPAVLDRTGAALEISVGITRPPVKFVCGRCGHLLARLGDIPGYGPLFVSWWDVEPEPPHIVVNGRRLRGREAVRHRDATMPVVYREGEPLSTPLRHGVTALLALPAGMRQDYPDLLVRCVAHGDAVLDRVEVIARLRAATPNRVETVRVPVGPPRGYREPRLTPGPQETVTQREVRRYKPK